MDGTTRLSSFARALSGSVALPLAALAALAAIGGVGCGGSEGPSPSTPAQKSATPDPQAPNESAAATPAATPAPVAASAPEATDGPWPFGPTPSSEDRNAQLERLKKNPGPIKSNWVPPGRSDRYGHAEGLIAAPVDAVRTRLLDFGHYKDLAGPKFSSVKVVDKQGQNTDVYFQLPIMKGVATIWYVTRFPPSRATSSGDVLEGTFVKGNIKNMHIAFTVRPGPDEKSSVMVCDLVLRPNVPAPQSALDEELRDACGDAINSVRKTIATP